MGAVLYYGVPPLNRWSISWKILLERIDLGVPPCLETPICRARIINYAYSYYSYSHKYSCSYSYCIVLIIVHIL